MAKAKKRKPAKRKTAAKRKPAKRKNTSKAKRSAGAKKAARTKAANKRKRSLAGKKAARTRKRNTHKSAAKKRNPVKRRKSTAKKRKTTKRKNAWFGAKKRHSKAAKKGWSKRKRKTTSKRRRKNPIKRAVRRYGKRRSNPGVMGLMMKKVLPVAASLYVARLISGKVAGRVPGIDQVPEQFRSPVLAALLLGAGHYLTGSKSPVNLLKKHREGIMVLIEGQRTQGEKLDTLLDRTN